MTLNRKRLIIVLALGLVAMTSVGGLWALRARHRQRAANLARSVESYLKAGNYDSARVQANNLLQLSPRDSRAYYLKAMAMLAGEDVAKVRAKDTEKMDGIKALVQATRLNRDEFEAHQLLLRYFLTVNELSEAANHGREVLRQRPEDNNARFAVAAVHAMQRQTPEAIALVEAIFDSESPTRPRTVWLAAQLSEGEGPQGTLRPRVLSKIAEFSQLAEPVAELDDRLALVELLVWNASNTKDAKTVRHQIEAALGELERVVKDSDSDSHLKQVMATANRLIPRRDAQAAALVEVYAALAPKVDELIDRTFAQAMERKVDDPLLYVDYATRLRRQGKADEAVKIVLKGIDTAKAHSAEFAQSFAICDLWLAEHYLSNRLTDKADTHIEQLLRSNTYRPWGNLLKGYRLVQRNDFDGASSYLFQAVERLPEDGPANALYGLCQLRRGFVSQGREYLQKGVRLGASAPQYRAWLAMALAEGGYHEQAMQIAKQVLADPSTQGMGRALLGQLRLRAGDFEDASKDFTAAIEMADDDSKPGLRYSQAELALARNQWEEAKTIIDELKKTNVAPRAFALEYRYLKTHDKSAEADALLAKARAAHPHQMLLTALAVSSMVEKKEFDSALATLEEQRKHDPKSVVPMLLMSEIQELKGDEDQSIAVLQKAKSDFPNEVSLRLRLAEKLIETKRFPDAQKALADLKGDSKVNPTALDYLLARFHALQGEMDLAEETLKRASVRDPDNPALKLLLGKVAANKGDYQTASDLFQRTLNSGAFRQQTINALFESLLRLGDTDRAISLLGRAERGGQKVSELRRRLLYMLARQEQWSVLDRELTALLASSPTESDYNLAVAIFRDVRQFEKAEQTVNQALTQFPKSVVLQEQRVFLLVEQKKYDEADRLASELLRQFPNNATLHSLRVYGRMMNEKLRDADVASLEGWTQCPGNDALVLLRLQILLKKGDTAGALIFADRAHQDHPKLPDGKYLTARAFEAINKTQEAVDLLGELVQADPANGLASRHYLRLLLVQGRTGDLEQKLTKLVDANPKNALLLGVLGEMYAAQGNIGKTVDVLKRLEAIQPNGPVVAYLNAVVSFSQGDLAGAEKSVRITLADPQGNGHVPGTFLLARIRAAQQRFKEALQLVEQVRRQSTVMPAAHLLHAQLLAQTGQISESEKICRDYLKVEPNARAFQVLLAQTLMKRNTTEATAEATNLATNMLQAGVDNPRDFQIFAEILLEVGRKDPSKTRLAKQIIQTEGVTKGKNDLILAGARACLGADLLTEAIRLAEILVERDPQNSSGHLLLADALGKTARSSPGTSAKIHFEKAAEHYQVVLNAVPSNLTALNNLAWTVGVEMDQPRKALEVLMASVPERDPLHPKLPAEVLDTMGVLHYRLNELNDAQRYLQEAINRNKNLPDSHYHLGLVFDQLQRVDLANASKARAQQLAPRRDWSRPIEFSLSGQ